MTSNPKVPRELRYKEQFQNAFEAGATNWQDELTYGMLAEYASEIACDLVAQAEKKGRKEAAKEKEDV
jgi:hypothetical protein